MCVRVCAAEVLSGHCAERPDAFHPLCARCRSEQFSQCPRGCVHVCAPVLCFRHGWFFRSRVHIFRGPVILYARTEACVYIRGEQLCRRAVVLPDRIYATVAADVMRQKIGRACFFFAAKLFDTLFSHFSLV